MKQNLSYVYCREKRVSETWSQDVYVANSSSDIGPSSFGLHDSHVPARPRAKWHYNRRMKDAVVKTATLLDWSDVSFACNVNEQLNLIKERIVCLRDRFATIRTRKCSN